MPHAGICAGGRPQGRSLPHPLVSVGQFRGTAVGLTGGVLADGLHQTPAAGELTGAVHIIVLVADLVVAQALRTGKRSSRENTPRRAIPFCCSPMSPGSFREQYAINAKVPDSFSVPSPVTGALDYEANPPWLWPVLGAR